MLLQALVGAYKVVSSLPDTLPFSSVADCLAKPRARAIFQAIAGAKSPFIKT